MFKLNLVTKSMLAAGPNFNDFLNTLKELFNSMFTPLIAIASALAVIWGVYLGFKYWRSGGDENKRKEAKSAVVSFVIGIIVIFIVAVAAPLLIKALSDWLSNNQSL